MNFKSYAAGFGTALLLSGALAFAQGARVTDDTVVADVNGQKITYRQLLDRLLDYHAEYALEAMVNRAIVQQAADSKMVTVSDVEVSTRLEEFKKALSPLDPGRAGKKYAEFLASNGMTERTHREQTKYAILQEKLAEKSLPVTEADLERWQVRVIACDTRQKAMEIVGKLRMRANFATLAHNESDDPMARQNDGLIPPFTRNQMPHMWQHASKLQVGDYTRDPVSWGNEGKFIIIKLEGRQPSSTLKPAERQQLTALLKIQRTGQWLVATKKAARVTYPQPLRQLLGLAPGR